MAFLNRRRFVTLAFGAAACPILSRLAKAEAYPTRPVRIVVTFTPGGSNDFHARLFGHWLAERLGQPFIVENRPGGGGNVGIAEVVRSHPDGHTLLLFSTTHVINSALHKYDLIQDIAPVASFYRSNYVMLVNASFPAKTVPEFIAYAKANPGKINVGSTGIGSTGHLAEEMFKMMTGVNMLHVPYRGDGPVLADLIGGQVDVLFGTITSSVGLVRGGQLRALAVTSATRWQGLPDIPALAEFVPGYELSIWAGLAAPRNTPANVIDTLNKEVNAGLATAEIKSKYADVGTIFPLSPDEFGKLFAQDFEKLSNLIKSVGITLQ